MNEPYVYICYADEDRQFALSLRRELGKLGVRSFVAPDDIIPGTSLEEAITERIAGASLFIVLMSTHASDSHGVLREVAIAVKRGIARVAIRLDDAPLRGPLEDQLAARPLIEGTGLAGMDRVAKIIDAHLDISLSSPDALRSLPRERTTTAPPATAAPPSPRRVPPMSWSRTGLPGTFARVLKRALDWRPKGRQAVELDPVLFAASCPAVIQKGGEFSARFAVYVESLENRVKEQLRQLNTADERTVLGLRPERGGKWKVGAPITIRVTGPRTTAEPQERQLEWNGREHILTFNVRVADDAADVVALSFEVFLSGVSVAQIVLDVRVAEAKAAVASLTSSGRAPATAFASYAAKDRAAVSQCLSALHRWDPGLDVFMDCLDLKPNEEWKMQLMRIIPDKDAFFLFWSSNAKDSKWVRWEIDTRKVSNGLRGIQPMPLEDPDVVPPPEDLSHLHFRDRYLIARQASVALKPRRNAH
jgi:hypothetical protein